MLNVKPPKNLFYEGGDQAVLLLHSFTGTLNDVKEMAQTLNEEGFTCYVPCYRGHGLPVSEFVNYDIRDWWEDVEAAYAFLRGQGYQKIYVVGVSLGGIFSLKLAEQFDVEKVVVMSVPYHKSVEGVLSRLNTYGTRLQSYIHCSEEEQEEQMAYVPAYKNGAKHFEAFGHQTMNELNRVTAPILVMYGGLDEVSYKESAYQIEEKLCHVESKRVLCFKQSGHLMSRSKEQAIISEVIVNFFADFK